MKKLWLLSAFFLLTGCTSLASPSTEEGKVFQENGRALGTHYLSWPDRQQQLSAITHWTAQGSIAIQTVQRGWNASFSWHQQQQNYSLNLFGPLGTNHVLLTGTPSLVTLQTTQQTVSAPNAETLLAKQIGWDIPIENLYYWMRGLPAPNNYHFGHTLDMNNHLAQLSQQGWQIIYLRYVSVNGKDLPDRMLLSNNHVQVRIVITQWELN